MLVVHFLSAPMLTHANSGRTAERRGVYAIDNGTNVRLLLKPSGCT